MGRVKSRYRRCGACGEYHWTDEWPANHVEAQPARSTAVPLPNLFRDQINALWHPVTNREYESRAEYNAVAKERGLVEIGNEEQKDTRQNNDVTHDEVGRAIQMVKQGYKPTTLPEAMTDE